MSAEWWQQVSKVHNVYASELSTSDKVVRLIWSVTYTFAFRPSPRIAFGWRRLLLRSFGARIGSGTKIYRTVEFFNPANAALGCNVIIGPNVDFYNVATITVEDGAIISQHAHLCSATHDYQSADFALIRKPIRIGSKAWVCAGAFVGPGITVNDGGVVAARAVVTSDVAAWTVVGGNPAKYIKSRNMEDAP